MRVRRYVARSLQEALDRVRRELGPDAFILQTREHRLRWLPWWPSRVEVWAAWEPPAPTRTCQPSPPSGEVGPEELRWFEQLVEQDVDAGLAWRLVTQAAGRCRLARIPFDEALTQQLSAAAATAPVWELGSGPRVVMLVGPTGAGKTTTVAKLAANFALVAGWRVALVTTDTYRIGAIQQLRTYAELIGLPLEVARDGQELRQVLAGFDAQLVLVDTAGHSPQDGPRLQHLQELCRSLPAGSEVMLVIPAALRQRDLAELLALYRKLRVDSVCVSKLDETRRRGPLLNAPFWLERPLRFVTTGQAVPDDIEVAEPRSVVRWLLRCELAGGDGEPSGRFDGPGAAGRKGGDDGD